MFSKRSLFITSILISIGGFFLLSSSDKNEDLEMTRVEEAQQEEVRQEIANYLNDYRKLKDQKEKYLEAERMMGKAFLLLMANLGLRLSPDEQAWIEKTQETSQIKQRSREFETITQCPETLDSGPEVIINPYEKVPQCPECPVCPTVSSKSFPVKKRKKNSVLTIDGLKIKARQVLDQDIFDELFNGPVYDGAVNEAYSSHVEAFLGNWSGEYRIGENTTGINLEIERVFKKQFRKEFRLRVKISEEFPSDNFIHSNSLFKASHPVSHNHSRGGTSSCRGLVLDSEDGLRVHLFRVYRLRSRPDSQVLYARIFRRYKSNEKTFYKEKAKFIVAKYGQYQRELNHRY